MTIDKDSPDKFFPLRYEDGPDYCTVKDARGKDFALTVQPDVLKEMESALRGAMVNSIYHSRSSAGNVEAALRDAFPHFQDGSPITPEAIRGIGKEYSEMVMGWAPVQNKIEFLDQDGKARTIELEQFDYSQAWVIPDTADWIVSGVSTPAGTDDLAAKLRASHQEKLALWEAIAGGPEPRCRDCADCNGRCQDVGLPCDPQERALERVKQLRAQIKSAAVRRGIYIASKVKHADRWRFMRDKIGEPIISTWIDEAGEGETSDHHDLWRRCITEASSCELLIVYREADEILKGAWVELGCALTKGIPVYAVGLDEYTIAKYRGITHFATMKEAITASRSLLRSQKLPSTDRQSTEANNG